MDESIRGRELWAKLLTVGEEKNKRLSGGRDYFLSDKDSALMVH